MKKIIALLLALAMIFALVACGAKTEVTEETETTETVEETVEETTEETAEPVVITVGATPAPHCEILEVAKELMAAKGYELKIQEFNDYIIPNTAVQEGELDANYFQHITYMNNFNDENGTELVSVAGIHYEPFGLYAGQTASLEELGESASIAVPNDATNEARALLLLEQEGLIKLAEGVGLAATKSDIVENALNLEIVEMEAAQLTATLQDVDMAVINGNYAIDAGLNVSEALAVEAADGTAAEAYVNVLTVKAGNEENEAVLALVEALQSAEVKAFIEETYAGAVVPLF